MEATVPATGRVALVADDHELFRSGAAAMLKRQCGYASVLQAGSLSEAITILDAEPEIVLACFDLGMPGVGNPASLKQVRERFPAVRIVVMTGSERRDDILLALQSGLHGYVPKSLPVTEIIRAFRIVSEGGIYVPQQLAELPPEKRDEPAGNPAQAWHSRATATDGLDLTKRQEEILRLIRLNRSNKEIGLALGLSDNTVKVHANALYRKLGVNSRQEAAALASYDAAERDRLTRTTR